MASASSGELGGRQALVTGGTGATGSAIASRLRQEGPEVWTVARSIPDDHLDPEHFIGADLCTVEGTTTVARHLAHAGELAVLVHVLGGSGTPAGGLPRSTTSTGTPSCSETCSPSFASTVRSCRP